MATVLIAGCGDVGTALGLALAADGHAVFGLRRDPSRLPAPIRPLRGDLAAPGVLDDLPDGVEHLVYAAAADARDDHAYARAYVEGPRNVRERLLARGAPLTRVVYASSTAVYGQRAGEWVDETSETAPAGFAGRRLLEGERVALAGPAPGTVVRFGGIYGPGRTRLVDEVRAGARCVERPAQFTNRIHRDDCARVLRHVLGLARPESIYVAVDDAPAPRCEVLDWIAAAIGAPRPRRVAPEGGDEGVGSKRCRNARLRASGFAFRYPSYREGYAALLRGEGERYR